MHVGPFPESFKLLGASGVFSLLVSFTPKNNKYKKLQPVTEGLVK